MEVLVFLSSLLLAFLVFSVLAIAFGTDSRDAMADDWSHRVSR